MSNSCSNYKIPEGLVINCEDALSGLEKEGRVHGSQSLSVFLKTLSREDDGFDVLWSLHSRGYVGLSEFTPPPPTAAA